MRRSSRGTESVVDALMLVPVVLAMITGLTMWVTNSLSNSGKVEDLCFCPDSFIDAGTGSLFLHVKNRGSTTAVVYRVEVLGADVAGGLAFVEVPLPIVPMTQSEVVIKPGEEGYIVARVSNVLAGAKYLVKVYTRAGGTYNLIVQAK